MMLYKLTNEHGKTRNDTQWGPGITHRGTGDGGLCGPGFIHAYEHQLVAVLMNPIHMSFKNPRLWLAKGEVAIRDGQIKCGCVTLTTIREIALPEIATEMRVRFGILCTREVSTLADASWNVWNAWSDKWLSGEDRSAGAAYAAARAVADAEARAVDTVRLAYNAATWAAESAEASAYGGYRTLWASAGEAAAAAATSALRAHRASCCDIDLVAIAEKACAEELRLRAHKEQHKS